MIQWPHFHAFILIKMCFQPLVQESEINISNSRRLYNVVVQSK